MRYVGAVLFFLLVLAGCGGGGGGSGSAGSGAEETGGGSQPFGLDARVAPSGLQIPIAVSGSTQLTPVDAFPNLRIPGATFVTHAGDGSNRLFVTDRNGEIFVFANDRNTSQKTTLLNLSAQVDDSTGEGGMFGLAFDPGFSTNGYFYVSYGTLIGGNRKFRVSRFRLDCIDGGVPRAGCERVVLELEHANGYHFGGWIGFAADGTLYISHGDSGIVDLAQDPSSLAGKILRIRVNADGSYSIPSDNPSPGSAVWASGFRNPWRCSIDRANGDLWCGDVGDSEREEVNRVKKGGNYGWPIYEGSRSYLNPSNRPYTDFEPPMHEYDHTVGVAVIGGYVYRGQALPALVGRYLYADAIASKLWSIETNASGGFVGNTAVADGLPTIYTMGEDQAGEIYAATDLGIIYGFEPAGGSGTGATMPATLSATGLFTDMAQLTPAPGMIDYAPNAPFWSDGAQKRRWVIVPDGQSIGFAASSAWTFPVGTITVKHFDLPLAGGGTTRLETRVMVHRSNGWSGYTYRWRGDQQDADLVPEGGATSSAYQTINPATGAATSLAWKFPSRTECLNCHTSATGRVLGLNTRQFNSDHTYAATGRSDNQLRTLNHIGLFSSDIGSAAQYEKMPSPRDTTVSLEARAKAYLDTNCAICHLPGGPTPVQMDLRYATSLADMQLLGVASQGSVSGVRITAGNHAGSLLWQRASSSVDSVRMPPLGVQMVDEEGVKLLSDWIDGLPP